MKSKRGDSQQFLQRIKNKQEILQELGDQQQERIEARIGEIPVLKLGNVKPEGISLELRMREIE
jgi:hypothetical protein